MTDIDPTDLAQSAPETQPPAPVPPAVYRPWSHPRVWAIFFLGMHAAGFMTFFFHPFFALCGFGCGLPAVLLSSAEIRDFPEARRAGPVKWGRITGQIGLIGGPIALLITILIGVAIFA